MRTSGAGELREVSKEGAALRCGISASSLTRSGVKSQKRVVKINHTIRQNISNGEGRCDTNYIDADTIL